MGTAEFGQLDASDVPELVHLQVWPAGDRTLFVRVAPETVSGRRLFGNGRYTPLLSTRAHSW